MNRTYILIAAVLLCHPLLSAQAQPESAYFQALTGGRGGAGSANPIPRQEKGKPFSATATTRTTQTFLDGTHVSRTTTMLEYRDAEGRVRTEVVPAGAPSDGQMNVVTIRDPVDGVVYALDLARNSATRTATAAALLSVAVPRGGDGPVSVTVGGGRGGSGPQRDILVTLSAVRAQLEQLARDTQATRNNLVEDLGLMTVNGVPANGTRTTTIVPVGAIGNDREFRSISERWFSSDLNLLIKSVSSDPRFGTTTYELTNISLRPPEPSLFQVPANYSVVSR